MALPPLYKYLGVEGARLTLRNRTFKHSKPSDFNDTEDLTIQSIFPEPLEDAYKIMYDGFTDTILKNIDAPPTGTDPKQRLQVGLIQEAFRNNPDAASAIKTIKKNDLISDIVDLEHAKKSTEAFIKEINEFLQGYRVLCVSERIDSDRMWTRYADNHQGIGLRILPNLEKDSKFSLFRKVDYQAKRPALFDNALTYQEKVLFGDHEQNNKHYIDRVIYSKTLEWEYEKEYRLSIPVIGEDDWNTLAFHPEEISELYLGANMNDVVKAELVGLAKSVNPKIFILQSIRGPGGQISFYKF
jgi:Protein of unknown function (DUF2971)